MTEEPYTGHYSCMLDAQVIELVKLVAPTMLGAVLALAGVHLTNRYDTKKRRQEMLRGRGEELFVLNEKWLSGLVIHFIRLVSVMEGKLTYNQAFDLMIADKHQSTYDFDRIEMLIEVYFPSARPAYDRVIAGRETLNHIQAEHKRAYETGDFDGARYIKPFRQAIEDITNAGTTMKEAIIKDLRSI